MANKRDVEFSLSANVVGADKIEALRKEVEALAKQGGAVGPEFQQLANELDRLGKEASGLKALGELAKEIEALGEAQTEASAKANALSTEMRDASAVADEYRAKQDALKTSLNTLQDYLKSMQLAQKNLRLEFIDGTVSEKDYIESKSRMARGILDVREEILKEGIALRQSKEELVAVEAAEKAAVRTYEQSAAALKQSTAELEKRQAAQRDGIQDLNAMGVATDNLAEAEGALIDKFRQSEVAQQQLLQTAKDQKLAAKEYEIFWSNALYAREQGELRAAEAARQAAAQQEAAMRKQMAEEDALLRLQERTMFEMQEAAKREMAYELEAIQKVEQARTASAQRQVEAQKAIADSFKTTGATNVAALREEIGRVNAALETLKKSGNLTGAELQGAMRTASARVKELELQIREATGALTVMDRVNKAFASSFGQTFAAFVASNIFMRVIDSILGIGRAFFDVNKDLEQFRRAMNAVFKDTDVAAQQLQVLRQVASQAGVSVNEIGKDFIKFSAAMQGAGISINESNMLFERLTKASVNLGLSSADVGRALNALGQIASKGTVSMEELRQQLGDALPGAFSIAAKGLGVTEKELNKLVASGTLAASDFLPAFSDALKGMSGNADTAASKLAEMGNVLTVLGQTIGDAGVWQAFKVVLGGLLETIRAVALAVGTLAIGFKNVGESIGVFVAALVSGQGLSGALNAVTQQNVKASQSVDDLAKSLGYGAESGKQMASALADNARATIQSQLAYVSAKDALDQTTTQVNAHTKAVEASAAALENEAKLFGSAEQQAAASAAALDMRAQALLKQAESESTLASLMETRLAQMREEAQQKIALVTLAEKDEAKRAKAIEDINKQVEAFEKDTKVKEENAAKTAATAAAMQQSADAARLETEMLKDNTDSVAKLTAAYTEQVAKLKELQRQKAAGADVDKQIEAQQQQVDMANKMRLDALDDRIRREKALSENRKAGIEQTIAANDLRMTELQGVAAMAKNIGDENLVRTTNVQMLKLQIEQIRLKAEMQRIEAEGEMRIIELERQKIESTRQLTETERIELDTKIKLNEIKIKMSDATRASTRAIEEEIRATENSSGSLDKNANAREKSNASREKEIALIREKNGVDAEGFVTDKKGGRMEMGVPTWMSIYNDLKGYGVDEKRAKSIANEFVDSNGNLIYFNNPGQRKYNGTTMSEAVRNAAQGVMRGGGKVNGGQSNGLAKPAMDDDVPAVSTPASTQKQAGVTMNFTIGGQKTTIGNLTTEQAGQLKSLVEQLSASKGTAA